ncbi:WD repeat-containing protein WRAP73 isoform X10 [Sagmatias obliquidens]|uniref:WD repeat-containing protein WRAP73 isoform X10 n=1 Tax=Sagmatias obliquidens TaxID=3371155 RepID=UPI000F441824|nr:WD repeat-containing protein WRAP73 isoform X10 [Lagenorhynchus obliquidens]
MHASARSPDWLRRSSSVTSGRGGAVAAGWVSRSWGPAAAMNFSEAFKLSSLLCKFSPDGKYLASCVQYRLVVRDANTLQICQLYTCLDQIQHIEWSADSLFILCALYKRGLVQVWSVEQPEWHCKIDEGSAGLAASCWSPDGRHVLNTTEFHLRITVWSLCTKSVSYIKYPKACQQGESARGITFTRDGRYLALAERRDCKDYVSILVCSDWQLLRHFDTDTQDLAGIEWAPNGCVLAVWDSCLEYKILLYSLDGRLLSAFCAYEWSLGIKSVAWSPSSQFLAVGSYDGKVRILNHVTWKMITEFGHPATINNPKIAPVWVLGDLRDPERHPALGGTDTLVSCLLVRDLRWVSGEERSSPDAGRDWRTCWSCRNRTGRRPGRVAPPQASQGSPEVLPPRGRCGLKVSGRSSFPSGLR